MQNERNFLVLRLENFTLHHFERKSSKARGERRYMPDATTFLEAVS